MPNILKFGKYNGCNYIDVWEKHRSYCCWVLFESCNTTYKTDALHPFRSWLKTYVVQQGLVLGELEREFFMNIARSKMKKVWDDIKITGLIDGSTDKVIDKLELVNFIKFIKCR